ncbi:transposase [Leptospira bouyouniensis]|uniref:Transposase n=1 Tax=Leptospira bouyouniensis TaxID=2484911 RepID=A0A7I0HSE6_9LEPT|nr:DDE-type integrase/transposase/recombinase [Leptospira bouyouniensis]TGL06468.1 transposase [Leptospira bouyouniensis]
MARSFNKDLFHESYLAWKLATSKRMKGEMIKSMMKIFGLSKDALYRRINRYESGEDLSVISGETKKKTASKLTDSRLQGRLKDINIIAANKFANLSGKNPRPIPTELAIQIAKNKGEIDYHWTVSTADRWLKRIGCTAVEMNAPTAALKWKEPYSNSTWMFDASVFNRYYLNPAEGKIKKRAFLDIKDEESGMEKDKLVKIWLYACVDVYSKVFFLKAYGGQPITSGAKHRGENATDYLDFFKYCFLEKEDLRMPVFGIPELVYSDKGSGIMATKNVLLRLGVQNVKTHLPGNPRAKGAVERRIGVFKTNIEPALDGIQFETIDDLNEFLHEYCVHQNQVSGRYDLWIEGTNLKPVKIISEQNFYDAMVSFDTRVVDNYGCVSYRGRQYGVAMDLCGQKVTLFRDSSGEIVAEDSLGNTYICDSRGAREISGATGYTIQNPSDAFKKTDRMRSREEVREQAKEAKKTKTIQDILNYSTNLRYFPARSVPVEVRPTIAPKEIPSAEEAWSFIERRLLINRLDLPKEMKEAIDSVFNLKVKVRGFIPDTEVYEMHNIINKYLQTKELEEGIQ